MAKQVSVRSESVRLLVLGAALVAGLAFAGRVGAQPPCFQPVCGFLLDCPADALVQCSNQGCVCRELCNRDAECGSGKLCSDSGVCIEQPERCSDDSHCPDNHRCATDTGVCFRSCTDRDQCGPGQACRSGRCDTCTSDSECGPTGRCASGRCEQQPRICSSNRDCDDGRPCNGEEVCDMSVCRRGPRPCTADFPSVARCVVEPAGSDCFRCEVKFRGFRPVEGEIAVDEEPVTLPPGVGPNRETGPILPPSGGGKGSGFRVRGVLRAPLSAKPPLDLPSGRLRIVLTDQKGRVLFDQAVAPGAWTGTLERGYALSGPAGLILSARVTPKGGKGDYLVEIDGIAPDPALAKRFSQVRPVLALTLEWKDAASTVAVTELGDCSKPKGRGRTPQALRCKSKGYIPAAGTR